MRTRYRFILDARALVVGMLVLYGDHDEDADAIILKMQNEALALAKVLGDRVVVERDQVEIS